MMKFFITVISYLQKMFPLGDNVLIAASALNPLKRRNNITSKSIKVLAKAFSHVVSEEEVSVAEDEWKLLQTENDDSFLPFEKGDRADHWWRAVFKIKRGDGDQKYPTLEKVIKSTLCLPCGNGAVERSLSDNKRTVEAERDNFMEDTIINLRCLKEHARACSGAENVVVTKAMIKGMAEAKAEEVKRLKMEREAKDEAVRSRKLKEDEEKRKEQIIKDASKSKQKLEEKEVLAEKSEKDFDEELQVATRTLSDANRSLKSAMEKKDNIGMRVACDLVDSSQKKIEAINEMRKKQSKERGELNKKRKSTIEGLFSGMKKKKET